MTGVLISWRRYITVILSCIELSFNHLIRRMQRHLRYSSEIPTFYRNGLAMSNIADMTGGESQRRLIAVYFSVSAFDPLVAFTTSVEESVRTILLFSPGQHTKCTRRVSNHT
jgi:hypothetical protein